MNNNIRKLTVSALVMAVYIVLMYFTQSVAFGAYQIRIATAMYALAYIFPFLMIPMGLSNFIANFFFGGLGIIDMMGGFGVGVVTTAFIVLIRKYKISSWAIIVPIILVPGLLVPAWLSYLLHLPYSILVVNVLIGQTVPAVVGALMIRPLESRIRSVFSRAMFK